MAVVGSWLWSQGALETDITDVGEALDWLSRAFGFTARLRIANHRAQLHVGDGAVVLTTRASAAGEDRGHAVMVRSTTSTATMSGLRSTARAFSTRRPTNPYGERQYTVLDPGGHVWTFSQSIADVDPLDWGGSPVAL